MKSIAILLLCLLSFCYGNAQILFEEVGNAVNFNFTNSIQYGTGVSLCDFDGDGWDDISCPSNEGESIAFFKNNNGSFQQIQLDIVDPLTATKQVVWIDYDNDGDKDLFVASEDFPNKLYENNDFSFTDVTVSAGLPSEVLRTNSGSWGDYDNDGDLDLFLANRDITQVVPNMLFKNNGDGTFTNVNQESTIGNLSTISFQGTFFDYNNDGFLDIFLINDRFVTENILYKNNGDGTFSDVSEEANANYVMNAMSIALDDFNSDGYIDLYITNTHNPQMPIVGNSLLQNNGDGTFSDISLSADVSFDSTAWGASFLDGNNNGRLDLYVSGSRDTNEEDFVSAAFYYQNIDQTFERILDNGFETDLAYSYGNATGDFNNDGWTDIAVSNNSPYNFYLWENKSHEVSDNNYLKISLEGVESNRDGYGSKIEISIDGEKQYRVTANTESYLSQNSDNEIFGLGAATEVDYLKITWLSGQVDIYENVSANQLVTAIEGQELVLSTDSQAKIDNFKVYPNPASSFFTIQNLGTIGKKLVLTDTTGKIYQETVVQENNYILDLSGYSNGIYFLQVFENGVLLTTKKLIKTKSN